MGVWIETSHEGLEALPYRVTPYVGVWIETLRLISDEEHTGVTPYVGVWIETDMLDTIPPSANLSLLMWECGLKLKRN